jgi:FeS assembly SUF system protein
MSNLLDNNEAAAPMGDDAGVTGNNFGMSGDERVSEGGDNVGASGGVTNDGGVAREIDGAEMRDRIEETLRTVFDPEIPVNIFDLGLVYEIKIDDGGKVKITMTLTAPACPVAGDIVAEVQQKTEALEGVADCHVQLTFDPPWTKEMMSEEAKLELGFF